MAEMVLAKKRLSINLSFLSLAKPARAQKSPKVFNDPNGVVGLQIVAALNHDDRQDSIFINGCFSSGLVPIISPKFSSSPIPILASDKPFAKSLTIEEMELCEEYTCVISHVGDRLIKKREYFEADLLGNNEGCERIFVVSDNTVSYGGGGGGGGCGGFLNTCFLCDKLLDGLDIFMYRGEKAFCSVECRHKHIAIDESKEKRHRSGKRKPMDCSVSPCSTSPLQFCAGVAAA